MPKDPETSYRGQPIRGHAVRVGGTLPAGTVVKVEDIDIGDRGQMLISWTCVDMGHKADDKLGGLVRRPKLNVTEVHVLEEHEGDQLLIEMRERDDRLMDVLLGRAKLPFEGTDPVTGEVPPDDGGPGEGDDG